ncbi:hypothetical protein HY029_05790 [Candidatus Gottesmanbacteria bacterium]|nr:hypothetical protein [Candidatus Gottesmanbacteria bacterium]
MLSLKPIPESKASGEVVEIYISIKQTFGLANVPVVFQYLAAFPKYLSFIWDQALKNLNDREFKHQATEIEAFAKTAIQSVYSPQTLTKLFLEKLEGRAERQELGKFVATISQMNASLYLLSLAIRESLKGKYLGIKQIGEHLEEKEKTAFNDLSEGYLHVEDEPAKGDGDIRTHASKQITYKSPQGITTSVFAEFFKIMEKEMERLIKEEKYLTRRVELERFALSRLQFMPHPLDSSITSIFREAYDNPQFPELIYLIADLFPTQTPFKLMASAVMKESLNFKYSQKNSNQNPIILPSAKN